MPPCAILTVPRLFGLLRADDAAPPQVLLDASLAGLDAMLRNLQLCAASIGHELNSQNSVLLGSTELATASSRRGSGVLHKVAGAIAAPFAAVGRMFSRPTSSGVDRHEGHVKETRRAIVASAANDEKAKKSKGKLRSRARGASVEKEHATIASLAPLEGLSTTSAASLGSGSDSDSSDSDSDSDGAGRVRSAGGGAGAGAGATAASPPRPPGAPAAAAMSPPRTAGAAGAGAAGGVGNAIQQIARLQVRCFLLP